METDNGIRHSECDAAQKKFIFSYIHGILLSNDPTEGATLSSLCSRVHRLFDQNLHQLAAAQRESEHIKEIFHHTL
jgi:hypothetical protein